MGWTVVNTLDMSGAPESVAMLEELGTFLSLPPDREQVLPKLAQADAYLASASVKIDQEFLDAAPNLRVIGSPSTGTDHMDMDAIRARGIECYDIAKEFDLIDGFTATSELTFCLLLAVVRGLSPAFDAARRGDWARERFTGFQLHGKTLGILGLGRLGKISARIGQGFGMRVIANDNADVSRDRVDMVSLDELLARSDALTIHVHLNEQTRGMIGERALSLMKPGAILLNTSRGAIIDETALLAALKGDRLGGAGLDVIDGEWLTDDERARHPLVVYAREHENLVLTPHIGGATVESIYGARVFMANKIADFIKNHTL